MIRIKSLTSGHLLHEDLDEAVLADGSQVLNDVLVLQVFVQRDLLVKRLRVPVGRGAEREEPPPSEENSLVSPAVSFGDFFDGQADLVAEVPACVHHPEGAFSQDHPLSVLVELVIVLGGESAGEVSVCPTVPVKSPAARQGLLVACPVLLRSAVAYEELQFQFWHTFPTWQTKGGKKTVHAVKTPHL